MKRLGRWLFNGVAAVSLLFLLAVVGLWIASYAPRPQVSGDFINANDDTYGEYWLLPLHGKLIVGLSRYDHAIKLDCAKRLRFAENRTLGEYLPMRVPGNISGRGYIWIDFHGRRFVDGSSGGSGLFVGICNYWTQAIPFYALVLASSLLPLLWIWRRRKASVRVQSGCCAVCGYDLRATPDHCPECGTVPDKGR